MTETVRVIGIGSPVEGDRIGMQLVERLRLDPHWSKRDEIEWLVLERPGAALLHYFPGADVVCLVDAMAGGAGLMRIEPADLLSDDRVISSHNIGVAEALQLAAALQQLPPRLLIYGVTEYPDSYSQLSVMLAEDLGP